MDNEYSVSPCKLTICIKIKCKWLISLCCESDETFWNTKCMFQTLFIFFYNRIFRLRLLAQSVTFAGWQSMHVKRSLSMYKEQSISAEYRPLYHFHIGSRPPYNPTLIMAPCRTSHIDGFWYNTEFGDCSSQSALCFDIMRPGCLVVGQKHLCASICRSGHKSSIYRDPRHV